MKHLYNEYEAITQEGNAAWLMAHTAAREWADYCQKNDFSMRDANEIIKSAVDVAFSEAILRAAVAKRKEERDGKLNLTIDQKREILRMIRESEETISESKDNKFTQLTDFAAGWKAALRQLLMYPKN